LRFGICSNLILETLIDADGDLEIPCRVRVDWQKVDSLHRARELASESDCTAHAQAICLLQERDQLVTLRKEIRRLAELVNGQRENAESGNDHQANAQLIPRDERGAFHLASPRGTLGCRDL